jgi:GR25 family glycosyltransferase involved in LPS biosynthesis/predicted O-methyltransferase YrrM
MKLGKAYILHIDSEKSKEYALECAESCEKHGVDYEMFKGFMGLTIEDLAKKTGWKIGREGLEENDRQYVKEYNAALGHIEIWRKIAESGEAGVILEHDCVVKGNFSGVEVYDGQILHLGPRVEYAGDYVFPDMETHLVHIRRHEGAHAYAMTPNTAKFLLEKIEEEKRLLPTEALISVRNRYILNLLETDPPYVVCAIGDRQSFTHHDAVTDKQNFKHHPGLLAGLTRPDALAKFRLMDYKFSEDWFSGNIEGWKSIFIDTDKKNGDPLKILEIGCFEGRATTWMLDNMMDHPDSMILCVDTFMGSPEHNSSQKESLEEKFRFNVSVSKWTEKVRAAKADSRFLLPALCREGEQFDIIYVDGSHATLDVVNDGIYSLHLLKKNGVIIFDDYQWTDPVHGNQPVKKAVDFLDASYPKYMKRVYDGYQRAYHKAP